jgi:hypothetical protein
VPTNYEKTVYQIKLEGTQQVVRDARAVAAATNEMKTAAARASTTVPVGAGMAPADAALMRKMSGVQAEAAVVQARAQQKIAALDAQIAAEAATTRARGRERRPAFGERGRAVAEAVGAGRLAGLAGPFRGWGPLLAVGAGFAALDQVKDAIKDIGNEQRLAAQTAAGIKSTGGAANVTAGQIDEMSMKLMKLSGIEHQQIHDAENVLLTFTGVRNEVGKGNDIFNRASLAVVDLASRMHTTAPQAALQLGKALQDPVRGLAALRREGIMFTKQQEDQIKVLVASGNRLGAQKLIIDEVEKSIGGSAKAAGQTLPAALVRLDEAWKESRNKFLIKTMPYAIRFTDWLAIELPRALDVAAEAMSAFNPTPKDNVISRWVHRTFGGTAGESFDYLLTHGAKDIPGDIWGLRRQASHGLNVTPGFTGSKRDQQGLSERARQRAAVGGVMLDERGRVVRGLGSATPFPQQDVRVHWDATNPLDNRPIQLVVDGKILAQVNNRANKKTAHQQGRGTAQKP